jgi:hypothetical protein
LHVQRIARIDLQPQAGDLLPHRAPAAGQGLRLAGQRLEGARVVATGQDLEQLGVNGHALRRGPQRFAQDFFGLQVAAVGQVDIGLGHRIDIARRVDLAGRVHHRAGRLSGVDVLAAAAAKEGIGR